MQHICATSAPREILRGRAAACRWCVGSPAYCISVAPSLLCITRVSSSVCTRCVLRAPDAPVGDGREQQVQQKHDCGATQSCRGRVQQAKCRVSEVYALAAPRVLQTLLARRRAEGGGSPVASRAQASSRTTTTKPSVPLSLSATASARRKRCAAVCRVPLRLVTQRASCSPGAQYEDAREARIRARDGCVARGCLREGCLPVSRTFSLSLICTARLRLTVCAGSDADECGVVCHRTSSTRGSTSRTPVNVERRRRVLTRPRRSMSTLPRLQFLLATPTRCCLAP